MNNKELLTMLVVFSVIAVLGLQVLSYLGETSTSQDIKNTIQGIK